MNCKHHNKSLVYGEVLVGEEREIYLTYQCDDCGMTLAGEQIPDETFDNWYWGSTMDVPQIDVKAEDAAYDKLLRSAVADIFLSQSLRKTQR
jgi:hypothetical protein